MICIHVRYVGMDTHTHTHTHAATRAHAHRHTRARAIYLREDAPCAFETHAATHTHEHAATRTHAHVSHRAYPSSMSPLEPSRQTLLSGALASLDMHVLYWVIRAGFDGQAGRRLHRHARRCVRGHMTHTHTQMDTQPRALACVELPPRFGILSVFLALRTTDVHHDKGEDVLCVCVCAPQALVP